MAVFIVVVSVLFALYALLLLAFAIGWWLTPRFHVPAGFTPADLISVIIPARNEAGNIGWLLHDLSEQYFPKDLFEVILIDDFSDDETVKVASGFLPVQPLTIIRMADLPASPHQAFKKAALAEGIRRSSGKWIVTTDADCRLHPAWLMHLAAIAATSGRQAIAAPVRIDPLTGALSAFQALDFMMMQGITAAAAKLHMGAMANGANFMFSRAAYNAVNGYEGTTGLASGDDYHLLQKIIKKYGQGPAFLMNSAAMVDTAAQPDLKSFLQQRVRWASKSGKDSNVKITLSLAVVYLFNLSLGALWLCCLAHPHLLKAAASLLLLKILAELALMIPLSRFFKRTELLISFPFLQVFHITYIILAGFLGLLGKYQWKGRAVK